MNTEKQKAEIGISNLLDSLIIESERRLTVISNVQETLYITYSLLMDISPIEDTEKVKKIVTSLLDSITCYKESLINLINKISNIKTCTNTE